MEVIALCLLCPVPSADLNECLNQTICGHGRCVNTEGSYKCNCFQGYRTTLDNACQGNCLSKGQRDPYQSNSCEEFFTVLLQKLSWPIKRFRAAAVFYFLSHAVLLSSLQMWMSVCFLESVTRAAVSIWMAPTDAPVTMVTRSLQIAEPVKVCIRL